MGSGYRAPDLEFSPGSRAHLNTGPNGGTLPGTSWTTRGRGMGISSPFSVRGFAAGPRPGGLLGYRDLYLAHFAITDGAKNKFRSTERVSRAGPGLAGARTDGMDVWLLNWSARMEGSEISLEAKSPAMELTLKLTPRKPPVLHGQNGFSKKGPGEGRLLTMPPLPTWKPTVS